MPESGLSGTGSDRLDRYGTMHCVHPNKEVEIALVGKYIQLHDAYISVVEALKHGGICQSCYCKYQMG